ncbi:ABCC2 (predicted) [Pycnogonum litorale]
MSDMDTSKNKRNIGILSNVFLWWITPILKKGRKGHLSSDADLRILPTDLDTLADQVKQLCKREVKDGAKQKLTTTDIMRSIFHMIKADLLFSFLMCFTRECLLALIFPIMLGHLVKQMKSKTYDMYKEILLASIVITILLLMPIARSLSTRYFILCGLKSKYALNAFMYDKVMRLTTVEHSKISSGKVINLISSNFDVIEKLFLEMCFIPVILLQTIFATVIIWRDFGALSSAGVLVFLLVIPVQYTAGKMAINIRSNLAKATDERIKIIDDILKGIKVIKMYAWENIFVQIISNKRRSESAFVRRLLMTINLNYGILQMIVKLVTLVIITMFIRNNDEFTPDKVCVLLALVYSIKCSRSTVFSRGISSMSMTITSIQRLQAILDLEEASNVTACLQDPESLKPETFISITNVSASWRQDSCVLKEINFHGANNDFVTVIGSVGSGKSSILLLMLNELRPHRGSVDVSGSIAYVSQQPWIFSDTLVNNITFGRRFDRKKLDKIIDVCSLKQDINSLRYGYHTSVGERGTTLSGGQRARVSLARALYQDADIYILDDPLSAVDGNVGRHILQECLNKYLKNKMRILVTNQLQYLQDDETIILIEEGNIKFYGLYKQFLSDTSFEATRFLTQSSNKLEIKTKSDATVNLQPDENEKSSVNGYMSDQTENKFETNSRSLWNVFWEFFSVDGNIVYFYASIALSVLTGLLFVGSDYWLMIWVRRKYECHESKEPFQRHQHSSSCTLPNTNSSVYSFCYKAPSTNSCVDSYYFTIYVLLIISTFVCGVVSSTFGALICSKIARKLHEKMLQRIIYAPMYFFNTKPTGHILNRFTYDMMILDTHLPTTFGDFSNGICLVVAALGMIYADRFQIIYGTFLLFLVLRQMAGFYVPTMRALQHIKCKKNSTVCSHVSVSLDGLTTIRAYRQIERYRATFGDLQVAHISSSYILRCVEVWITLYGEYICTFQVILAILLFVIDRDDDSAESAGFIITQMIKLFTLIPLILVLCANIQNDFISAERIMEYIHLPRERYTHSLSDDVVSGSHEADSCIGWPQTGNIEFKDVHLRYEGSDSYALKDINFRIRNGEKIGVVGRTGAGKTSLVNLLFGFMDHDGTITIDGVDISKIRLNNLRTKLSVIPQEPLLFIGSLRYNLDPFEEYVDDTLWKSLKDVHLHRVVLKLPDGLDTMVVEGGLNFSYGQRQLLCLARVILRKNKVLILDEATANVDMRTDHLIQETIRRKFKECTVITIAHRINNVTNCHRVMVMDAGKIAEFAPPEDLIKNKNSLFYKFSRDAGLV